jgi:hypothetical protein
MSGSCQATPVNHASRMSPVVIEKLWFMFVHEDILWVTLISNLLSVLCKFLKCDMDT